jgi:hypothetical protein
MFIFTNATPHPLLPLALPMSFADGGDRTGNLGSCISDVTFTSRFSRFMENITLETKHVNLEVYPIQRNVVPKYLGV